MKPAFLACDSSMVLDLARPIKSVFLYERRDATSPSKAQKEDTSCTNETGPYEHQHAKLSPDNGVDTSEGQPYADRDSEYAREPGCNSEGSPDVVLDQCHITESAA